MTNEQRKNFEWVRDNMHADEQKEDKFCDSNCVWTDHHPDCVRAEPEWYHGVDTHGCNRFYHKTEARPSEFNTPLYASPPTQQGCSQRPTECKPLTDERLELVGHADLSINNIHIFNGYGEEVPEGRTPIYAGYKAAHGITSKE